MAYLYFPLSYPLEQDLSGQDSRPWRADYYCTNVSAGEMLKQSYDYGDSCNPQTLDNPPTSLQGYLFGHPISHSPSPVFHNTLWHRHNLPWTFSLHDSMNVEAFFAMFKSTDCIGASITMPHKIHAIQYMDDLTPEAKDIGAVNTVFVRRSRDGGKRYVGANTDCIGIRDAFPGIFEIVKGKVGMVIGGGATTRTAVYALWKYFDIRSIYVVNRDATEADGIISFARQAGYGGEVRQIPTREDVTSCMTPVIAVGAIPGIPPQTAEEIEAVAVAKLLLGKLDIKAGERGFLLDMCYHPSPVTSLARTGIQNGWQFVSGIEALIRQAVAQNTLLLERLPETAAVEEAAAAVRSKYTTPGVWARGRVVERISLRAKSRTLACSDIQSLRVELTVIS